MDGAPQPRLKLYGMWASPYVHRVQLALKLKGLDFEYVEEDLAKKSPSLLLFNPVHQKVPVLLHGDRPLSESGVILEYIDETWKEKYPLMPADPLERAAVRFWCHFAANKLVPSLGAVYRTTGEGQRVAAGEVLDNLTLLEGQLREGVFRGRRFFGGEKVGFLDIVLGFGSHWLLVFKEVTGTDLVKLDEDFPCLGRWLRDFTAQAEVAEVMPAFDKLLEYKRGFRQRMLSQSSGEEGA